jgi:hypothetical protein
VGKSGRSNAAQNASPMVLRTGESRCPRCVLPSISENRNVTVPVGRSKADGSGLARVAMNLRFVLRLCPSAECPRQRVTTRPFAGATLGPRRILDATPHRLTASHDGLSNRRSPRTQRSGVRVFDA